MARSATVDPLQISITLAPQLFVYADASHLSPSQLPVFLPLLGPRTPTNSHTRSLWLCKCNTLATSVPLQHHQSSGATLAASSGFCSYMSARHQPKASWLIPPQGTCTGLASHAVHLHTSSLTLLISTAALKHKGQMCNWALTVASEPRSGPAFCHWLAQACHYIPSLSSWLSSYL